MISPTGERIRTDAEGSGYYGAKRGLRRHNGIDFTCKEGQDVVAPFNLKIVRISNPKLHSPLSGIVWKTKKSKGKLFYFLPNKDLIGKHVKEGDVIGIAQAVSKHYKLNNMLDHIHFQVDK